MRWSVIRQTNVFRSTQLVVAARAFNPSCRQQAFIFIFLQSATTFWTGLLSLCSPFHARISTDQDAWHAIVFSRRSATAQLMKLIKCFGNWSTQIRIVKTGKSDQRKEEIRYRALNVCAFGNLQNDARNNRLGQIELIDGHTTVISNETFFFGRLRLVLFGFVQNGGVALFQ